MCSMNERLARNRTSFSQKQGNQTPGLHPSSIAKRKRNDGRELLNTVLNSLE